MTFGHKTLDILFNVILITPLIKTLLSVTKEVHFEIWRLIYKAMIRKGF